MSEPLHFHTISQLAPLIELGALSPVDLTQQMLDRIDLRDGELHAYVTVLHEQAMRDAHAAHREIEAGRYRGPLHGVPIAVKDLCFTAGVPTMGGCQVLANHVPRFDATVVSRLYDAGAILLGKLNLTEGAMAGYNPAFQVPDNPWRAGYWSGASSSGSGAATAAGLAFATLGSDTGGSIRHPAAACGTVGLKPSWGRVSRHGVLDLAQSLDHVGPLTRSSRDAGYIFNAIAGHDPLDPTTLQTPLGDTPVLKNATDSTPLKGLKVGFDERFASEDIAADFTKRVRDAVACLEQLGADIVAVTVSPRLRDYMSAWQILCSSEAAHAHQATYPSRADEYGPWFREWLRRGNEYSSRDYADAHITREKCNGELATTMHGVDLLACPTSPREAYPVTDADSYGPIPPERDPWNSRFTVPMDYAGLPTLSLPCGLSTNQLPLSFQLVGHKLSEALLVATGHAFEEATEWHRLRPPGW
jgi:amidase